ncbi:MAG: glycine cleavage system protein GcvH [Acidilobaceae archaeon]
MVKLEVQLRTFKTIVEDTLLYTRTDEWIRVEDGKARVGITDYAQRMLRDIVGVELPKLGLKVSKGQAVAVIESIKATVEVYTPITGTIIEINERLRGEPELLNRDPYGNGWIFVVSIENRDEIKDLITPQEYILKIQQEKR